MLLDGEGGEVYSGPNRDVRAFFEGMEIDGRVGGEVYRLTGHTPSFLFAPARLAWLRTNDPEAADSGCQHVLTLGDWLGIQAVGGGEGREVGDDGGGAFASVGCRGAGCTVEAGGRRFGVDAGVVSGRRAKGRGDIGCGEGHGAGGGDAG